MLKKMSNDDKRAIAVWDDFVKAVSAATPAEINESIEDKRRRIKNLESKQEDWFKYYFPHYYSFKPARFHIDSTRAVLANPEWMEVRAWSRELSKSARTMMEILYLAMLGKKKNILLISKTADDAIRLLKPYMAELEGNNRLINDYGEQRSYGIWAEDEFRTLNGVAFRGLGWGKSPRGTRSGPIRPDVIILDDIDDDADCRNPDTMTKKMHYIENALIPTRSISNPLLMIVNGNIIARNCVVKQLYDRADRATTVNIRDENGKSTWPEKNTEGLIDRALSKLSYEAIQREYYNNPMESSDLFSEIPYIKPPKDMKSWDMLAYADPSPSNNTKSNASKKVIAIIARNRKTGQVIVLKAWIKQATNEEFVLQLFDTQAMMKQLKPDDSPKIYIENNSLQNPFYEQAIKKTIAEHERRTGQYLLISPDSRKKPPKYERVEATLQPIHGRGDFYLNATEADNPHMKTLASQFSLFSQQSAHQLDGPDCIEGGTYILLNQIVHADTQTWYSDQIPNRKY